MGTANPIGAAGGPIGLALQGFSQIFSGMGSRAGSRYEAKRAKNTADIARLQADQTDVTMREELDSVLGSIQAIRASTGADPSSPTSLAVMQRERGIADRERRIRTGSLRMQAFQSEEDARFHRYAGRMALTGSVIKSLPYFLGAK